MKVHSLFITAHAGHWIVDALTLIPVALIAVWFLVLALRDRRRRDRPDAES